METAKTSAKTPARYFITPYSTPENLLAGGFTGQEFHV
jgi:hypothetical protein